ncbi:S-layer homology domain-containing protein [Candidatus Villigracilis affinis]|uniref:S-layer homology domain-containing protein n=1 Tax=Candidatus Villigracilis affinis TaxID=3140682 RepID=UPI002A1D2FB1|nr:S-layer homology domain-containing protein [Anaerolineales bacterium]
MKKLFTVLLLAVFMLAQFSMASAATVAGDASITAIPDFSRAVGVDVDWAATGMAAGTKNILIWSREYPAAAYAMSECQLVATINGTSDASGTFTYDFTTTALALANGDQIEFTITVDTDDCAGAPTTPATDSVMGTSYVDTGYVNGIKGNPPSTAAAAGALDTVSCNTFEYWALGADDFGLPAGTPYSGVGQWFLSTTGTFAPPAPIGATSDLLSWKFTFPPTATGPWTVYFTVSDKAGNVTPPAVPFRNAVPVIPAELAACDDFTDTAGHENEVYVRYLADLGLISGFADGSFGPDNTLTRAEAATLFEISNGYDETLLPTSAPAGCDFTDVSASDWFAGWVWQACDDGFMNGVGGGLFDPNNLLTRGQIVTIMGNVANASPLLYGGFINTVNIMTAYWGLGFPFPIREAAWTDVPVGAYYATPVIEAYGLGIADGTSDTTFSPDQPVTRGEFAKMLYRALSRQ